MYSRVIFLTVEELEGCRNNLSSRVQLSIHSVLTKDCLILSPMTVKDNKGKRERYDCYLQE